MSTDVDIVNSALDNLGEANISSLSEASKQALVATQHYPRARDSLLSSYPWRFAFKRAALATTVASNRTEWQYVYVMPNDCLKIRLLVPAYYGGPTSTYQEPYVATDLQIFANITPAYIEYTRRVTDASIFPPLFEDALSWSLSARMAMPLTRKADLAKDAREQAMRSFLQASAWDANQQINTSDSISELENAHEDFSDFPSYVRVPV